MGKAMDIFRGRWADPFREVAPFSQNIERLFGEMLDEWRQTPRDENYRFSPACEVLEDDNNYMLKFDLPGVTREQIEIELNDRELRVSAQRKEEKKQETRRSHLAEVFYGAYERLFTLPSRVDETKIDAKYDNGVLSIVIPKVESQKAKHIAVH